MVKNACFAKEDLFTEFVEILCDCDKDVKKGSIVEEQSYQYAVLRTYCKALLSCKEIICLLLNDFPDGAMALSRQVYEGWVIIRRLLTGYRQSDTELIERFFDSIEIFELKQSENILQYVLSQDPNSTAEMELNEIHKKAECYLKKYNKTELKKFSDYWWANCNSFKELISSVGLSPDYMYSVSSNRIHLNITSMFIYMDQSESGILLGPSSKGWKLPLQYMALCLRSMVGEVFSCFPAYCSQITLKRIVLYTDTLRQYFSSNE